MGAKLYRFEVTHHEYGTTIVESIGPESATNAAAKVWGAPWKEIAGWCRVVKLGTAKKPRCRKCGREYGEAGNPPSFCPDCLRAVTAQKRQIARIRSKDRRAGMRE